MMQNFACHKCEHSMCSDCVSARSPSPTAASAAGCTFANVMDNQVSDIVINGLYASYRCKLWVMEQQRKISLGTVGKERDWRNKQRRNRNKSRSRADVSTLNMLVLIRYVQEVAARAADGRCRAVCGKADSGRYKEQELALATEQLAMAMLHGRKSGAPLAQVSALLPPMHAPRSVDDVGYVYSLFRSGSL